MALHDAMREAEDRRRIQELEYEILKMRRKVQLERIHTDDLEWIINSLPPSSPSGWIPETWLERKQEIVAHLENIIESRRSNDTLGKNKDGTPMGYAAGSHVNGGSDNIALSYPYEHSNFRTTIPMSKWRDISAEEHREYRFPDGEIVRIDFPRFLLVSKSGGHRIFDGEFSHYVPPGWIHLVWKAREGHNHFDF